MMIYLILLSSFNSTVDKQFLKNIFVSTKDIKIFNTQNLAAQGHYIKNSSIFAYSCCKPFWGNTAVKNRKHMELHRVPNLHMTGPILNQSKTKMF
jgi:hypothetical protein